LQHPSIGYYSAYQKRDLILSVDKTIFTEGAAVFDDAFSRWSKTEPYVFPNLKRYDRNIVHISFFAAQQKSKQGIAKRLKIWYNK
jgi:hypothetical protein